MADFSSSPQWESSTVSLYDFFQGFSERVFEVTYLSLASKDVDDFDGVDIVLRDWVSKRKFYAKIPMLDIASFLHDISITDGVLTGVSFDFDGCDNRGAYSRPDMWILVSKNDSAVESLRFEQLLDYDMAKKHVNFEVYGQSVPFTDSAGDEDVNKIMEARRLSDDHGAPYALYYRSDKR